MKLGLFELIFLVVLIAMPVSSYWFVFKPRNEATTKAWKEIEQKERMLEKLDAANARTDSIEARNSQMVEAIDLVEGRLPSTKEVDKILTQVATLAREAKLQLPKVKTMPPIESAQYMEQPLEVTMRGDGDDFYSFLLDLEDLERITRIPEMKIERLAKQNGIVEVSFTLSIYFQRESTPALAEANQ